MNQNNNNPNNQNVPYPVRDSVVRSRLTGEVTSMPVMATNNQHASVYMPTRHSNQEIEVPMTYENRERWFYIRDNSYRLKQMSLDDYVKGNRQVGRDPYDLSHLKGERSWDDPLTIAEILRLKRTSEWHISRETTSRTKQELGIPDTAYIDEINEEKWEDAAIETNLRWTDKIDANHIKELNKRLNKGLDKPLAEHNTDSTAVPGSDEPSLPKHGIFYVADKFKTFIVGRPHSPGYPGYQKTTDLPLQDYEFPTIFEMGGDD